MTKKGGLISKILISKVISNGKHGVLSKYKYTGFCVMPRIPIYIYLLNMYI